jgi:hypothetical protein
MERLRDRRPLHPLEPCGGVQPDFCRISGLNSGFTPCAMAMDVRWWWC